MTTSLSSRQAVTKDILQSKLIGTEAFTAMSGILTSESISVLAFICNFTFEYSSSVELEIKIFPFKDVLAKNFFDTDFLHTFATVR